MNNQSTAQTKNFPDNAFEVSRKTVWKQYQVHLKGSPVGAFLIVSSQPLTERAVQALLNSSAALSYGKSNTTFFTLDPCLSNTAQQSTSSQAATEQTKIQQATAEQSLATPAEPLKDVDIFRLVESLDPLCIVIADLPATQRLAQAYRAKLLVEAPCTLLGHDCICFSDFDALLNNPEAKQKAWSLLKTLPRRTSL